MKFIKKAKTIRNSLKHLNALSHSYAQSAEDVIIYRALSRMKIKNPAYLDIGCNHPVFLNNTYLLYKNGGKGILVDANPGLSKIIKRKRPEDIFINTGIADKTGADLNFYVLSNSALSTFDKNLAEKIVKSGNAEIVCEQKVPVIGINDFLKEHYSKKIDFVSLDIEGYDSKVIKAWDFNQYRPVMFCVETISNLAEGKKQSKAGQIFDVFEQENYIIFADTYVNTIFIDAQKWQNR